MSTLALIPARGGSKGIPRKNLVPLAGRPLIEYAITAGLNSKRSDRVIVSTDDEEIARVSRAAGAEVPFTRPAELANESAPMVGVVRHALSWLTEHDSWQPDAVALLQPTSPLRTAAHVDTAVALLGDTGADTVVSVVELPHRFSPYCVMREEDGLVHDFWTAPVPFDRLRRQEHPRLYARNGPAVLVTRSRVVTESDSLYGERVAPFVMPSADSIDIDEPFDLEFAEWLVGRRAT